MGRRLLASILALFASVVAAFAHPHVWTDMRSSLIVDAEGFITGIRAEWTFDEGYSTFALEGLDADGDGVYGPDELRPLTVENIQNLAESEYFVFPRLDGKLLPHGPVTDYAQTYNNSRLTLFFVLPLQTPVDPRSGAFSYKVYDPDFFISFDYMKDDPVELEGNLPAGCVWRLEPLLTDEELEQKRNFLAEKGKDWQNDTGEDFGSLFSRPVVVTCGTTTAHVTVVEEQPAGALPDAVPGAKIDPRKLLVPPKNPDGSFVVTPFSQDPVRWMRDKQQNFYSQMSSSIRGLNSSSPMAAAWTLMLLSFLYGVFHAAGPGHGKAVISGWLLATASDLKRGVAIAALSALFQALTAIVIVSALLLFVQSASTMARDVAGFLESASYLMIAGLGLYLIWGAFGSHRHVPASPEPQYELVSRPGSASEIAHVHDEHCGHAHAPEPAQLQGDWSWSRAVALAFAVGLRPCTGALLVLIFSWSIGLYWAGVLSTLVMALGVFITIAVIASLAVYAKTFALRFAAFDNRLLGRVVRILRVACGLGIAALGGLMFWASLGAVNGMM